MKRAAVMFVALALVLAACQAATEKLSEKIAEQATGVEDVNIDTDTGEVSIKTDEGSLTIGGGEIPNGFPIPLPDGYKVMSVVESGGDASVGVLYPQGRYDELISYFDDWSGKQGGQWTTGNSSFDQGNGQVMRSANWYGDTLAITVTDCFDPNSGTNALNSVCVTVIAGL